MHELTLLQDLAIVMTVSAVTTLLFHRLRLPVVLGYILAGLIIGPYTPPFPLIKDFHSIHTLSELGIIFLLFSIGLEFSFSKLAKVGFVAIFGAVLEIVLMIAIGYGLGRAFGWNFMDSLFLGAILSISSTTIIVKVLMEMKIVKEKFAQVILGILIIEDLLAIIIIALLSGLAVSGTLGFAAAGQALLQVTAFIAGVLFFGYLLVPRLLAHLERLQIPEMMIVSVVGLCFAAALIASKMGFSVALGAFLIGAIIAETKQGKIIVHQVEPIKDMFTAVFFVSVGMLIQPQVIAQYWFPILMITLATILAKVFSCSLASFLAGSDSEVALKVGLGLAQIGEFSFIIARLGESTDVTSHFLYPVAVSISGITTLTTPFLMRSAPGIIESMRRITPRPLATFLSFYTGWVQSLGKGNGDPEKKKNMISGFYFYGLRFFIYAASALIFSYGLSMAQARFQFLSPTNYWMVHIIGLFPFVMGSLYTLDRILWNVLFLNWARSGEGQAGEFYTVFRRAARFALVLLGLLIFLPFMIQFIPSLALTAGILLGIGIFGYFLWGSMARLHDKIETTVLSVFDKEASAGEEKQNQQELLRLIREEYPWEVETADFLLPFKECGLNQRIRDLRLRGETGASIVSIYRDSESLPNPSPDTVLMPGDVLLLMGDKERIKAAVQFLHKKMKEPLAAPKREGTPKTQTVQVTAEFAALGKTLRELKLRRKTGTTILGIQKEGVTTNNPDGETLVESGDTLLLFGWPDEIELAVRYLSGASE